MKTVILIQKVTVETPKPCCRTWADVQVGEMDVDDNGRMVAFRDRTARAYRSIESISSQPITFTDPSDGQSKTLLAGALIAAMNAAVSQWVTEDIQGIKMENGVLVKG